MEYIDFFQEIEIAKRKFDESNIEFKKLNNEYENIIKKVQEYSKTYKTKDLYNKYMNKLENCKYKIGQVKSILWHWKGILDKSYSLLNVLSKFECDKIGPVIAKLMSYVENNRYIYHQSLYTEKVVISDRYGTEDDYDDYDAFLVSLESSVKSRYEEIKDNSGISSIPNSIILRLNNRFGSKQTEFAFYDKSGNKLVNTKKYDYIYEFINYIIGEKIKNKTTQISDEELFAMLDIFLETYDINSSERKKRK